MEQAKDLWRGLDLSHVHNGPGIHPGPTGTVLGSYRDGSITPSVFLLGMIWVFVDVKIGATL